LSDASTAAIEDQKLQDNGIRKTQLDSIHKESQFAELKTEQLSGNKVTESNEGMAMAIGYGCGILIYITMLVYGMMVMRGVMEEKTNRIAEVIVSSVKPFQLMMGKIIGIGAVGITQFLLWIVLMAILITAAQSFIPHDVLEQAKTLQQNGGMMPGGGMPCRQVKARKNYMPIQHSLSTANWPLIIGCFAFYFLGGYLILCGAVCSSRKCDGRHPKLTKPYAADHDADHFFFRDHDKRDTEPNQPAGILGKYHSIQLTYCNDGADFVWRTGTVPYWQLGRVC
jgi:ABC-2 type transport system permease protein